MNYLLKSSNYEERRKNARQKVLVVAVILVILIVIISTGPIRRALFFVVEPAWRLENIILNSRLVDYFKSKSTLLDEKLILEQKLFLAGQSLALVDVLKSENDKLKDLLGRKELKRPTVLATILVKPPRTPYDQLIVDIGSDQGVAVGAKVIANGNVYLGEVSEIYSRLAKITLYSAPGQKLAVVLGTNSVTAEAVGIGGGNFNISLPQEVEVKEGDIIVIPAITPNVFGIVEKVNFKDKDSFQTILFKSPVNISELSFVEIVI